VTDANRVNTTTNNKLVHTPMLVHVSKVVASSSSPTSAMDVDDVFLYPVEDAHAIHLSLFSSL